MEISPYTQDIKPFLAIKNNAQGYFLPFPKANHMGGLI